MEKSVGIIIPSYNMELYLEKCVEALVSQLGIQDEIIIVNDGSTDNTENIGILLSQKYDKVTYLYKTNGGLSSARNFGVEHSTGKYISFVDADDYVRSDYLKIIKENLQENIDVLGFGLCRVVKGEKNAEVTPMLLGDFYSDDVQNKLLPEIICDSEIFHRNVLLCSACTYLYSRDFLISNKIQFLSERIYLNEDLLFNIEVFSKAKNVKLIADVLYYYVCREGSLTQQFHPNIYETKRQMCLTCENIVKDNNLYYIVKDRINGLWIKGMYECIVHSIWKYSQYNKTKQIENVKQYLNDDNLIFSLREFPKRELNTKGKIILYLMSNRMCRAFIVGYKLTEKIK